jgi:hypothetical protein
MAVTLYRQIGKGKARRYQKVNLGRGRRPVDLAGPYFLRSYCRPFGPLRRLGGGLARLKDPSRLHYCPLPTERTRGSTTRSNSSSVQLLTVRLR